MVSSKASGDSGVRGETVKRKAVSPAQHVGVALGGLVTTLPDPLMALTLQQPWASAVRDLGKHTENRSWPAPERVLGHFIAIHAGRTFREEAADWLAARTGRMLTRQNVPLGAVVALARVVEVVQEHPGDPWFAGPYGWVLGEVMALTPVHCRGHQQLWNVSAEVRTEIETQWLLQMSEISRENLVTS